MPTTDELLDLAPNVGQRQSTIRWDVLDSALTRIGSLTPESSPSPARVTLNVERAVKRDLSSVRLTASDLAEFDPFAYRLRPTWVLQNGAEFQMGAFLLGSLDSIRQEWGLPAQTVGVDQTIILDQPVTQSVALSSGASIRSAIIQQFTEALVPQFDVDTGIIATVGAPIVWQAGTSRLRIVSELAAMGGAFSPYFDNSGVGQVRLVSDLSSGDPDHVYGSGGRIIAGSMVESLDLLNTPNRVVVIDSSAAESSIVGLYDVPDEAPHSKANRGYYVVHVVNEQGLGSISQANARAYTAYLEAAADAELVHFSSPPDPRHDTFDSVEYLGVRYREHGWSMPLREGAQMTHDLRKVYAP